MKKYILASLVIGLCNVAYGTITLQFSNPQIELLTNIADSTGTAKSGLSWGIVVDAADDGFDDGLYDSGWVLEINSNGVVMPGSFDDVFFFMGGESISSSDIGDIGGAGGEGILGQIAEINLNSQLSVSSGKSFQIIWFDDGIKTGDTIQEGDHYGVYHNSEFILPADGSVFSFYHLFAGEEPIRPANLTFIPEPSIALLGGLGLLGLLRRRR